MILIPLAGPILVLIWLLEDGQPYENQYGPDPKGRDMRTVIRGGYYPLRDQNNHSSPSGQLSKCPRCGAVISPKAVFCDYCGQRLSEQINKEPDRYYNDYSMDQVNKTRTEPVWETPPNYYSSDNVSKAPKEEPGKAFSQASDLD